MLSRNLPFALDEESKIPESLEELANKYRETHAAELEWFFCIGEADLNRKLETPFLPGCTFSIAQGLMQVCMHSHGHRSQCATRLRWAARPPSLLRPTQYACCSCGRGRSCCREVHPANAE